MLSVPHLVVIFLVALVVLGPEKLPQVARVLGKAMADFRRITNDFRVQIEDEMKDMERQANIRKVATAAPVQAANPELMAAPVDETAHESYENAPSHEITVNPVHEPPELTAEIDSAIAATHSSSEVRAPEDRDPQISAPETPVAEARAPESLAAETRATPVHEKPADGESQPA